MSVYLTGEFRSLLRYIEKEQSTNITEEVVGGNGGEVAGISYLKKYQQDGAQHGALKLKKKEGA